MSAAPLLVLDNVTKHFVVRRSLLGGATAVVRAVDGVSFGVAAGETLALVGELGCGKSTVGRLALRLMEPTAGTVRFDGRDLGSLSGSELRHVRAGAQLIFQDPYGSLNPRMTVGEMLAEPLLLHTDLSPTSRRERVADLLRTVGLRAEHVQRYPHEFSGGQRQRIAIARALRRRAQAHRLRRAGLRTRRLDPQPDPEPPEGPAAAARARLRLHQPRSCRGEAHRRARGRHVPRAHRRERGSQGDIRRAAPPLYAGPALRRAGAVDGSAEGSIPSSWRPAQSDSTLLQAAICIRVARMPKMFAGARRPELAADAGEVHATACHRWRDIVSSVPPATVAGSEFSPTLQRLFAAFNAQGGTD